MGIRLLPSFAGVSIQRRAEMCFAGAVRWGNDGCDSTLRACTASSPLYGGPKPPPLRYGGAEPAISNISYSPSPATGGRHSSRPARRTRPARRGNLPYPPVPHNQGSKHTLLSTEVGILYTPCSRGVNSPLAPGIHPSRARGV